MIHASLILSIVGTSMIDANNGLSLMYSFCFYESGKGKVASSIISSRLANLKLYSTIATIIVIMLTFLNLTIVTISYINDGNFYLIFPVSKSPYLTSLGIFLWYFYR